MIHKCHPKYFVDSMTCFKICTKHNRLATNLAATWTDAVMAKMMTMIKVPQETEQNSGSSSNSSVSGDNKITRLQQTKSTCHATTKDSQQSTPLGYLTIPQYAGVL
jgi:hypothetical protein